ncbi:MAG: hypothetical protein Q7U75_07900, partial [Desulfobacterales bacterium]|nr:hypothetical protein [Desulfobacterales bacterium]
QARGESWHFWYVGVRVGSIAATEGLKGSTLWVWDCGFHTGSRDGLRSGSATSYAAARKAFEAAWLEYLPTRTAADFDGWRHQAAWTAEKYARWDRGDRSAPPWPLPGFVFREQKCDGQD